MAVYEGCFTRLCNALAANNMYARTVGFIHPAGRSFCRWYRRAAI